jgi:hypothetical protein
MTLQRFRSAWIVAAALCLAASVADPVQAQGRAGRKGPGAAAVYGPILQQLKQAQALLREANRDYDGHRARAAVEVHKAMQLLKTGKLPAPPAGATQANAQSQPKAVTQPLAKAAAGQPGTASIHEAQANSDEQMQQAGASLKNALGQLQARSSDPRATAAVPLVQQAIQHIEQGLAFVQQKENSARP